MARRLREKEQHDVALWAHAMERINRDVLGGSTFQDPLLRDIMSNGNNIPFIITDENLRVVHSHLIPDRIIEHPDRLREQIDRFTEENTPIPVKVLWSAQHYHIIFYGKSALLKSLYYFPYVQILVITAFIALSGSAWPRRPPTSWARPPRRCSGGSNTCARSPWTSRPWTKCRRTSRT